MNLILLQFILGIIRDLADGKTLSDEQRAQLRQHELDLEAQLVKDIDADLGR